MTMQTIYEETADRTLDHTREDGSFYCDYFRLDVKLYKEELSARDLSLSVHVLVSEYESYVGDPDDPKQARRAEHGTTRRRMQVFTGGPDSKYVRRAIAVIDGFKEPK